MRQLGGSGNETTGGRGELMCSLAALVNLQRPLESYGIKSRFCDDTMSARPPSPGVSFPPRPLRDWHKVRGLRDWMPTALKHRGDYQRPPRRSEQATVRGSRLLKKGLRAECRSPDVFSRRLWRSLSTQRPLSIIQSDKYDFNGALIGWISYWCDASNFP